MSHIKDIQVKDSPQKDIYVLDKSIINNVFLKDFKKAFQYKKAEKLAQAVHVVLQNVPTKEGVTDKMSTLSLRLIEEVLATQRESASKTILEIISLFSVGEAAQIFAPKNATLLVREYQFLLASICEPEEQKEVSFDLSDIEVSNEIEEEKPSSNILKSPEKAAESTQKTLSDRKGQIIAVLKDKGKVGIKDISNVIRDCSPKTIQRELQTMIDQGIVIKEGERRWSTYSLN